MTIRDDLIPLIDEIRDEVVDGIAGLRVHTVVVRTRTWSGTERGRGTATDVDVTLSPVPKVVDPAPRAETGTAGRFEAGDRLVEKVSLTYTRAQLDGGALGARVELYWLIDGEPYRVVAVEERYLAWRVQLRRMR